MADTRPPIPAELKRKILVESGHRCAIPTCRHIEIDIHHIIPWETCKEHKYENLIALCPNCHRMAHAEKIDRKALRIYKSNLRYTHDRFSQFEVDMLFEAYQTSPRGIQWPPYLMLLIKRLLDSGFVQRHANTNGGVFIGGMKSDPDVVALTKQGKEFVESLGLEHDW